MSTRSTMIALSALSLSSLFALAACSGSNADAASVGDNASPLTPGAPSSGGTASAAPAPAPVPPAPKPPACFGGGGGNANGVCTADTDILTSVEKQCAAQGLRITAFEPNESCGVGSSSSFSFACCARLGQPPPPPPPPPCVEGGMANANGACSPDATMEASALSTCTAEKLVLTTFTGDEKCGKGSSSSATYKCCPQQVPPPPQPVPAQQ